MDKNINKKKSISITLHPDILVLLNNYVKENNRNKSSMIEDLIKKYFKYDEK